MCCRKFFEILLALSKIYAKCKIRVNIYVCRNIVRFVEYLTIQVVLYETESNILKFKSFIRSLIIIWNFTFSVEYEVTNIIKSNSKNNSEAHSYKKETLRDGDATGKPMSHERFEIPLYALDKEHTVKNNLLAIGGNNVNLLRTQCLPPLHRRVFYHLSRTTDER